MGLEFSRGRLRAPDGVLMMYSKQPWKGPPAPVFVVVHGVLRNAADHVSWIERLDRFGDVVLIDLPGHGDSDPVLPASLENLAKQIMLGLKLGLADREVFLIGESLGGLIALAIATSADPSPVVAVLAADPPLASKKQPHVHSGLFSTARDGPEQKREFLRSLLFEVFGANESGLEERLYYDLLGKLAIPTMILNGDVTLFPLRNVPTVICVMDEVDRYIVNRMYGDKVLLRQRLDSGHLLLTEHPDWCIDQLLELAKIAGTPLGGESVLERS